VIVSRESEQLENKEQSYDHRETNVAASPSEPTQYGNPLTKKERDESCAHKGGSEADREQKQRHTNDTQRDQHVASQAAVELEATGLALLDDRLASDQKGDQQKHQDDRYPGKDVGLVVCLPVERIAELQEARIDGALAS